MTKIPNYPFLTTDFSPKGGGIDFLGLRLINLNILANYLLPGINNATRDMGVYFLGAWIPWKFMALCKNKEQYKYSNFCAFQEAIEVAISFSLIDESPASSKFGILRNRIGVEQKISLPNKLSFKEANRTSATSIYAAPLYGPSLRYLGLIAGEAIAEDGSSTGIPVTNDDKATVEIIKAADDSLKKSKNYFKINRVTIPKLNSDEIYDLGLNGLNPAFFRKKSKNTKRAFAIKLLPNGSAAKPHPRTLTAKLIVKTLEMYDRFTTDQLREVWYTGHYENGYKFNPDNKFLKEHQKIWAIFMARQYQRYIIELFLRCFEIGLKNELRSLEEIVDYFINLWNESSHTVPSTFDDILAAECEWIGSFDNFPTISNKWNKMVHGEHEAHEFIEYTDNTEECIRACKMLARWWLRIYDWIEIGERNDLLKLGGPDRISILYFFNWVKNKRSLVLPQFLKDFYSEHVFAQHIRIALSRFDGHVQRLRFVLGDNGIEPTESAKSKLAEAHPPWMRDRLDAFIGLLCDLSILNMDEQGHLSLGENIVF
jgi:hypothetical protein